MTDATELARNWRWVLAFGLLMVLIGVAAIAAPQVATLAIATLIGWLFLFAGASQLVSAYYLRHSQPVSPIVIGGLLATAAGMVMLLFPGLTARMFALLLGCFFLAEAVFKGVGAFDIRPHPLWGWLLADGVVTGILALLILGGWPSGSVAVIGLLVGISLVFSGAALTTAAFHLKGLADR